MQDRPAYKSQRPAPADPLTQLERFQQAVDLLGGPKKAAQACAGIHERTMQRFCNGSYPIHPPTLQAISKALLAHADKCRAAERALSPAFATNLTTDQRHAKPDGRMLKPE